MTEQAWTIKTETVRGDVAHVLHFDGTEMEAMSAFVAERNDLRQHAKQNTIVQLFCGERLRYRDVVAA